MNSKTGAPKETINSAVYSFKKGQELLLDDIYPVQWVAGGLWFLSEVEHMGDRIIIVRDITIVVSWKEGGENMTEEEMVLWKKKDGRGAVVRK